jgi:two-component system, NtrC family, response regulator AtoC
MSDARAVVEGSNKPRVLVVDDDADLRNLFEVALAQKGFETRCAASGDAALGLLATEPFDGVVTDLQMRGMNGISLAGRISETWPDLPVVVITAYGSIQTAVQAMRAGAYDFLPKPVDFDALQLSLRRAIEHMALRREVRRLRESLARAERFDDLVGESPEMVRMYGLIGRVAGIDSSVLLTGETGTGKGLVARVIHKNSHRASGPLVVVNCGALPPTLLESELFGHERGAFTDASARRTGLFVEANGGTLFLDEIATMPIDLQPKLLRALEERVVRPVGGNAEIPVDVRVIAATNASLESAVASGAFREDLYFRLNVIQLELPSLRARGGDVLLLAQRFLSDLGARLGKRVEGMSTEVAQKLVVYPWPGNVRELHNCLERAVALARGVELELEDLPRSVREFEAPPMTATDPLPSWIPLEQLERQYVLRIIDAVKGNRSEAARVLGLDRRTLYRKLVRWGLHGQRNGSPPLPSPGIAAQKLHPLP